MSRLFTISPLGGWKPGDRAYCLQGSSTTTPPLIAGKVYQVERAWPIRAMTDGAVTLTGVTLPDDREGIYGNRFAQIRPGKRPADELARHTSRKWIDAYRASVGQVPHPDA